MKIYSNHCENCGKYFEKTYRARFCSKLCSNSANAKKRKVNKCNICKHCLIPIYSKTRTGYCNKYCKQLADRLPCPVCGKRFISDCSSQVYCSIECKHKSRRKFESGYKECEWCGMVFEINSKRQIRINSGNDSGRFCSRDCAFEWRKSDPSNQPFYKDGLGNVKRFTPIYFNNCLVCGRAYSSKIPFKKYCSNYCYNKIRVKKYWIKREPNFKECNVCGKLFDSIGGNICCSEECIEHNNKEQRRNCKHRRRLLKKENYVEAVSIRYLFFRDNGRCKICGRKLNLKRKVPNNLAATIDHIIPLSKGGEHSKRNTQLACFKCNSKKGDRGVAGGEQLLLFG